MEEHLCQTVSLQLDGKTKPMRINVFGRASGTQLLMRR